MFFSTYGFNIVPRPASGRFEIERKITEHGMIDDARDCFQTDLPLADKFVLVFAASKGVFARPPTERL